MKRKFLPVAAIMAASALLLSGCSVDGEGSDPAASSEPKDIKDVSIGFAQQTVSSPYYVAMNEEAQRLSDEMGFTLNIVSADRDVSTQISQIEDLTSRGVDALIINTIEPTTEKQSVQTAAKKTNVIFIDTAIEDAGQVTDIVSDNVTIGAGSGKAVADRFDKGATIKLAILNGGPRDSVVGPERREGFLKGLDDAGLKYEIVGEANGEYAQETSVKASEDLLAAHPDIDVIFGYNDGMALGALATLRTLKNTSVLVAGVDGQKEALKEIADGGCNGQFVSTGLNSPTLAARDAVQAAIDLATGKKSPSDFEKTTYTKAVGIDCNNVEEYYDPKNAF